MLLFGFAFLCHRFVGGNVFFISRCKISKIIIYGKRENPNCLRIFPFFKVYKRMVCGLAAQKRTRIRNTCAGASAHFSIALRAVSGVATAETNPSIGIFVFAR